MLIHRSVSEKVSAEIHRVDDHYVLEIVKNLDGLLYRGTARFVSWKGAYETSTRVPERVGSVKTSSYVLNCCGGQVVAAIDPIRNPACSAMKWYHVSCTVRSCVAYGSVCSYSPPESRNFYAPETVDSAIVMAEDETIGLAFWLSEQVQREQSFTDKEMCDEP